MLRCVFVGSPNRFTKLMVHWLSNHSDLQGVVWTSSAHWAGSLSGSLQFAKKRIKRFGLRKAVDEALYYLLSKRVLKDTGEHFQVRLVHAYSLQYGQPSWQGDAIHTDNINSPEVIRFVQKHSPDVVMSMCINEFFQKKIREIPRLGTFLWHEGIVPEYKGLYSPFWAVHNREPQMLGYTVLRMNDRYDEGEVYAQGVVNGVNPRVDSPSFIGHKAILDSLPSVKKMFDELENGTAKTISTAGRNSMSYTYPGLTDWMRFRKRLEELQEQTPEQPSEVNSALRAESLK